MTAATYGEVLKLAEELTPTEQLRLLTDLAASVQRSLQPGVIPQELYGIWRNAFPADIDIDRALREIRAEWQSEWHDSPDP